MPVALVILPRRIGAIPGAHNGGCQSAFDDLMLRPALALPRELEKELTALLSDLERASVARHIRVGEGCS